jgi:acylphosphatase
MLLTAAYVEPSSFNCLDNTNLYGQVTGEAQGDSGSLKEFQQHLNKGPSAANVTKLDVNDIKTKEGESDFTQ